MLVDIQGVGLCCERVKLKFLFSALFFLAPNITRYSVNEAYQSMQPKSLTVEQNPASFANPRDRADQASFSSFCHLLWIAFQHQCRHVYVLIVAILVTLR